jgi:hypothetical protein
MFRSRSARVQVAFCLCPEGFDELQLPTKAERSGTWTTVIADGRVEEISQAVDFRAGQNYGERQPTSIPRRDGEKRIEIVQLAPAARDEPQVLVWVKKFGYSEMPFSARGPVPEFVSVISCG